MTPNWRGEGYFLQKATFVPIPIPPAVFAFINEFGKRLPSICDGLIAIHLSRPHMTREEGDQSIDLRRRGERAAERRRERRSDARTRRRWPGIEIPRPPEATTAVVLQTTHCSPARRRRRSRRNRPGLNRDWTRAAAARGH